jgi:hypothetical protein
MNLRHLLSALAILALATVALHAQDPLSFQDFAARVDPYFAPELVQDVKEALPQTPFDVWGYDVGDYSGDGNNDLVVSIRQKNDTKKRMNVFFFVDDEGMLRLIKQSTVEFVELPIEVGVSISQGNAYMMHKLKEFKWEVYGYRFKSGVMMMVDRFTTDRQGQLTYETYRNFQSLEGFERYLNTTSNEVAFRSDFLTTPSYERGRDVSTGYQSTTSATLSKYVQSGSYYWHGDSDCSFDVRSAYDNDFLYLNIFVRDDSVISPGVNDADTTADRLEIWLDMYAAGDRFRAAHRTRDFRMKTDSNIYALTVTLGDFLDEQPHVKISTSNDLDEDQTSAAKKIKTVAARLDSGYTVKIRIPFRLLGFDRPPIGEEEDLTEFGMTVVVHDVDNPYRAEETTTITTSQDFEKTKPATFGAIVLVPPTHYYGEAVNIFVGDLKERLQETGF